MHRILLALLSVTGVALATVAAPSATRGRAAVIPACEELMTRTEAALAAGDPEAFILRRAVKGHTRMCDYAGGSGGSAGIKHTVSVEWGPYLDARGQFAAFSGDLCRANKAACGKLEAAAKLQPDSKSFLGLEKALAQVGAVKAVHSHLFDWNPAFTWLPAASLRPYDEMAWVFVYVAGAHGLLQTRCTDNSASSADLACALKAADFAETGVT